MSMHLVCWHEEWLVDEPSKQDQTDLVTALHEMQTPSSDENSVCPSVKRVNCNKTEEKSVQIFVPYDRSFSLVFWKKRMVGGGRSLQREISGQTDHVGAKSAIFDLFSSVAP